MTQRGCFASRVVLVGAVTLIVGGCHTSNSDPTDPGSPASPVPRKASESSEATFRREIARIKDAMRADLPADRTPGAVIVIRRGARTKTLVFGYANRETRTPMHADDRFRIGSVTKTFVAAATLRLAARGDLSLHDTVAHWLPGLLRRGQDITVGELLAQTSGLPEYATTRGFNPLLRADKGTPRNVVGLVAHRPMLFEPGKESSYSNTNYTVLGLVLQRAAHRSLAALLQQQLFRPLHLHSVSVAPQRVLQPPISHGYYDGRDVIPDFVIGWAGGAGALVSNAQDVATFLNALLSGHVIPPAWLTRMESMRPMTGPEQAYPKYGLGLGQIPTSCGTAIGHGGAVPGFHTGAWATKDGSRSVVVLTNSLSSTEPTTNSITLAIDLALCGP